MEQSLNKKPLHVGIILDGNRRFAKKMMLNPYKGHELGTNKIEELLLWCQEFNIKELTLYAFSMQNFNRSKEEVNYLMKIFKESFEKLLKDPRIDENKIRINIIGRIHLFPKEIQVLMQKAMQKTKDYSSYTINFAMAYGGREEIVDAVKKIAQEVKLGSLDVEDIDDSVISDNLYLKDDPDLVIRTSGEKRISNFLIWQSNYSEWIFTDKLWPEFSKEDFVECLSEYGKRQRRFGK